MLNHFEAMQPIWDFGIQRLLQLQCIDPNSPFHGVIPDLSKGYTEPAAGVSYCYHLVCSYYNPNSMFYHNPLLLERAIYAIDATLSKMNKDGTLDLRETNFHCSSTSAFAVQPGGYAEKLLRHFTENTQAEKILDTKLNEFIVRSGDAMVHCGFHTPNHRWVISSALSLCFNLTGDQKYRDHIQKFLDEGIDCDPEGEYTERSAAIYNIICNRALTIMAEELNMPELYSHVTRNLNMVMKYIEPDESLCTLNSTRQDFGKDMPFLAYYENFLYMAIRTGNSEFAWFADYIMKENTGHWQADPLAARGFSGFMWKYFDPWSANYRDPLAALNFDNYLPQYLMEKEFVDKMLAQPTQKPVLTYNHYFIKSGIIRMRKGDTTLTVVKDKPVFLKLQYKSQKLYVRFAGAFFGEHSQFRVQDIQLIENGYRLFCHESCGYIRPFDKKPDTSDWNQMHNSERQTVCVQNFDINFDVVMEDRELTLKLDARGCDNIPVKLELMTAPDGIYSTTDTALIARPGDYIYLKQGTAQYVCPDYTMISIQGGFNDHWYGTDMRGALPGDKDAFSVVMTGTTPKKATVKVSFSDFTGKTLQTEAEQV